MEQDKYHCKYFQNILLEHLGNDSFVKIQDGTKLIVGLVFSESKGLETVEIPKSVESTGFVTITFPESIEYVDNYCMSDCINLKTIRLPKHMEGKYFINEFDLLRMNPEIIYY
ncbi:leucine-rich repeat protein [Lachnoanaerobaculum orale]|uniref:leucine-rich repeat protein n=1 Tax=Lachnoanaerobaculum orale TaxID=979627 RepID=UPI0023A84895|nr:leucine-rich repeat protein [Lachnoanaerobaculum orale]